MFMKKSMKCVCIFHLGCYLLIWHCYLGSILTFNIENSDLLQPLNKTFKSTKVNNMNVYLCFIRRFGCIYFFCHE